MLSDLTAWLIAAIQTHGILAVILGVAIETIIVPLPSPIILMTAGYILIDNQPLLPGLLTALWISVVAGLAQTIGSYLVYGIAYLGGKPLIVKFEKLHGISWKDIQSFEKKFSKNRREEVTLMLLRALPIMPLSVVSGVAGIIKMDFKKYSLATFIGTVPRNMILAVIGWQMKGAFDWLAKSFDHVESLMTLVIVGMILAYIVAHKFGWIDAIRKKILS